MDRLRAMRVLVSIADTGSLTATAKRLGVPLSSVSRMLAALEARVGTELVARTTRRVALTERGLDYVSVCRRVLEELDEAETTLGARDARLKGELAITAPAMFGRLHVLPVVSEFLALHPDIDARLLLVDRVVDLAEEELDVAVRIGPLADSALIATRLGSVRLVTCAAPAYVSEHGRISKPSQLERHACVAFDGLSGRRRWVFRSRRNGRHVVRVPARLTVSTADAAIEGAIAGVGIARVLSYQAAGAVARGELVTILDSFEDTAIPVHLVHRVVRHPKARTQAFLAFAAEALRARLGAGGRVAASDVRCKSGQYDVSRYS